jgi:hypothetical protein
MLASNSIKYIIAFNIEQIAARSLTLLWLFVTVEQGVKSAKGQKPHKIPYVKLSASWPYFVVLLANVVVDDYVK